MASILRNLNDADLETVHHLIRRDAKSDLEIAREAVRLGKVSLGENDHAKEMVVHRYRRSKAFQKWLSRFENQDLLLKKELDAQKMRFELISSLTSPEDEHGLEKVSKALQARALTLAVEAGDEELKEALGGKGWVANSIKLAQASMRDYYRRKVETLKSQLRSLVEGGEDSAIEVDMDAVVAKVDEVMGLG